MHRALLLVFAGISALCFGQETVNSADIGRADLVIVGTLRQDFKFPWVDGWNHRGHIDVERRLKGSLEQAKLPFRSRNPVNQLRAR